MTRSKSSLDEENDVRSLASSRLGEELSLTVIPTHPLSKKSKS